MSSPQAKARDDGKCHVMMQLDKSNKAAEAKNVTSMDLNPMTLALSAPRSNQAELGS